MQNRYAGDVGDFGKLGLLRQLISSQLDIGVNWYLVPDECHNADGKHIGYITDTRYNGCDDSLRNSLKEIVNSQRSVSALETMDLVPNAVAHLFGHRRVGHVRLPNDSAGIAPAA